MASSSTSRAKTAFISYNENDAGPLSRLLANKLESQESIQTFESKRDSHVDLNLVRGLCRAVAQRDYFLAMVTVGYCFPILVKKTVDGKEVQSYEQSRTDVELNAAITERKPIILIHRIKWDEWPERSSFSGVLGNQSSIYWMHGEPVSDIAWQIGRAVRNWTHPFNYVVSLPQQLPVVTEVPQD